MYGYVWSQELVFQLSKGLGMPLKNIISRITLALCAALSPMTNSSETAFWVLSRIFSEVFQVLSYLVYLRNRVIESEKTENKMFRPPLVHSSSAYANRHWARLWRGSPNALFTHYLLLLTLSGSRNQKLSRQIQALQHGMSQVVF